MPETEETIPDLSTMEAQVTFRVTGDGRLTVTHAMPGSGLEPRTHELTNSQLEATTHQFLEGIVLACAIGMVPEVAA